MSGFGIIAVREWAVINCSRNLGAEQGGGALFFYSPLQQGRALSILIRSPRPATEVIALLREKVRKIDPALPVFRAGPWGATRPKSYGL